MTSEKWFSDLLERHRGDIEFKTETMILDFTEKLVARMKEKNVTRAELARRLGVSKAFVTKLLNGNPNMTIKTMVSIADALSSDLHLDIYPQGFEVRILYVGRGKAYVSEFDTEIKPVVTEGTHVCAA